MSQEKAALEESQEEYETNEGKNGTSGKVADHWIQSPRRNESNPEYFQRSICFNSYKEKWQILKMQVRFYRYDFEDAEYLKSFRVCCIIHINCLQAIKGEQEQAGKLVLNRKKTRK